MRFRTHLLALLAIALLGAPTAPVAEAEKSAVDPRPMAEAVNAFTRDLYGRVSGGDGNLFLSPYSVHAAMLLTREGARGATADEMDAALGVADMQVGPSYEALVRALAAPMVRDPGGEGDARVPAYELEIANRLWGQEGFAFEAPFVERLAKTYRAPLARVDFSVPGVARKAINDWVAEATRKKIEDIVPERMPPVDTRLALANAIYLKAQWADPFRARNTKPGEFTGADGTKSEAQLMHRVGGYRHAAVDGVQVLEIPYRDGHLSMLVYLPDDPGGLADAEAAWRAGRLETERTSKQVDLKLPRFEFTTALDLGRILPEMGMPLAFDPQQADFSGMTKEQPLYIGIVLHKAFVGVDEDGTEAAAATVVMMRLGAEAAPTPPIPFHADHPFLFEIRNRATGAILFVGRVTRP